MRVSSIQSSAWLSQRKCEARPKVDAMNLKLGRPRDWPASNRAQSGQVAIVFEANELEEAKMNKKTKKKKEETNNNNNNKMATFCTMSATTLKIVSAVALFALTFMCTPVKLVESANGPSIIGKYFTCRGGWCNSQEIVSVRRKSRIACLREGK